MIGKTEWFTYRIFGWGLRPKTWQGWLYVAVAALLIGGSVAAATAYAPMAWVAGIVVALFVIDMLHIMLQLPKVSDERENYHQLLIERNCSFAAILAILVIAFYQAYQNHALFQSGSVTALPFDWSILAVLGVMFAVKVGSTLYLWKR